ncbi:MAG: hypothetical protein ABI564_00620 [Ideonella sp.]
MAENELDLHTRKQLLLTRIALERVQWSHDVGMVRTAASPRNIAAGAVRSILPDRIGNSLLGSPGHSGRSVAANVSSGVMRAIWIARRYPVVVSLAGALLARRLIRRVLVVGVIGAAVAGGVWYVRTNRPRS